MFNKYSLIFFLIVFSTSFHLTAQTQAEMNQTAQNDFNKADAKLNKLYKQVMKILDGKEKQLMILAQKDWLKFRDSQCKFEIEEFNGGSIQPLIYSTCLTDRTNDRIEDLKAILKDRAK